MPAGKPAGKFNKTEPVAYAGKGINAGILLHYAEKSGQQQYGSAGEQIQQKGNGPVRKPLYQKERKAAYNGSKAQDQYAAKNIPPQMVVAVSAHGICQNKNDNQGGTKRCA
jgi:hypothetical protein